jgi:predicted Ser/Thr protein kinase
MKPEHFLEDAERAEQAGDLAAAAVALRRHLERHPDDRAIRLRFGRTLMGAGEWAAARHALEALDGPGADDTLSRQATRLLAELDETEGALAAAAERWERLLADDIDDPQARARLALLRPVPATVASVDPSATLVSPEAVETSRYRLVRELGRGATATVFLARDVALDLDVALKVLHPQLAGPSRSGARRRFFAEARLAAAIRHPGVVAIYDVDEVSRALAMEYVSGATLRERFRGHPGGLDAGELDRLARHLLDALAFVHAHGIVHGDLKPSNLLLRAPGEVVIADFGAAQLASDVRASGPGGTPLYLAPEQFRGAPSSVATDLYATGAILWEAATGTALRSHADLIRGIRADAPPAAARDRLTPGAMTDLILTLLAPDPDVRKRAASRD